MSRYRQTMSELLKKVREEDDHEISMARGELEAIADKALKLSSMLKGKTDSDNLEAWVQSKITKAKDYVNSVDDYLEDNPDRNEKFTMKQYKKNENDNEHSLNALELVKAFGTPADKKEMQGIYDRHMKRGHISQQDYAKRNQIHNRYISKLKEEVDMLPENFSDAQLGMLKKAYMPLKGRRISTDQAHKLMGILDKFDSNKNALEKLAKAGIPFVSDLAVSRLISKHKYRADQLRNLKEEDNETERLKQELEKKDDQINLLKQKAEKDKAKATQAATQKMVNPETGEPLLQVGIAYKHLRDKMAKNKAAEAERKKGTMLKFNDIKKKAMDKMSEEKLNEDEDVTDKARSMGLTYMSFGRYGKNGKVTHKNVNGVLQPTDKDGKVKDEPTEKEPKSDDKPKSDVKTALDVNQAQKDIEDIVTDGMISIDTDDDGTIGMTKEYEPSQEWDAEQDLGAIIDYLKSKGISRDQVEMGIDGGEDDGYLQIDIEIKPKGQKNENTSYPPKEINKKKHQAYSDPKKGEKEIVDPKPKINEGARLTFESIAAVKKKAEKTGMSYSVLKQVYDRGMAAWKGGHRPGATQVQWALARVNSFVTKSSGTWGGADKDLAAKVKGSK